jgi:hypothetical protein
MLKPRQILYESLISTSRFPRWWILALVQASSVYVIGELLQPRRLFRPFSFAWIIFAVCIMAPVTVWLWREIESYKAKRRSQMSVQKIFNQCLAIGVVVLCSVALVAAAKLLYPDWLFSALVSSIISGTSTLAILFVVLCGQPFGKALGLALDTWNKKISLAAFVAFVLLLAHGVSFALVHGILRSLMAEPGFSVSADSATIWVLCSVSLLVTAFAAAFLNNFLVLLFLEIIGQKKDPEEAKTAAVNMEMSRATN